MGALAALAACSADAPTAVRAPSLSRGTAAGASAQYLHAKVCPEGGPGTARCHSLVRVDASGQPLATTTPSGYGPADLRSAYNPTASGSATQTIAIVDAYDDPNAENDVNVYRSQYGLPACTTATGCFRKVNQSDVRGSYPKANGSWAQEISLDLDMASAICPGRHILLVEANSASWRISGPR